MCPCILRHDVYSVFEVLRLYERTLSTLASQMSLFMCNNNLVEALWFHEEQAMKIEKIEITLRMTPGSMVETP